MTVTNGDLVHEPSAPLCTRDDHSNAEVMVLALVLVIMVNKTMLSHK